MDGVLLQFLAFFAILLAHFTRTLNMIELCDIRADNNADNGHMLSADLDCSSLKVTLQRQAQCFSDQGLHINLPTFSAGDSAESVKKNYVESLITQKADLMCTEVAAFQRALQCSMNLSQECMPEQYRGYIPDPKLMPQIVTTLCSNESKVDFECAASKASQQFDCGIRKGKDAFSRTPDSVVTILCTVFQISADCMRSELRSCGCSTVKAYEIVSRDLLYPPACPRPISRYPPVVCDSASPAMFVENTGSRHMKTAAVFCTLIATFVTFVRVFIL